MAKKNEIKTHEKQETYSTFSTRSCKQRRCKSPGEILKTGLLKGFCGENMGISRILIKRRRRVFETRKRENEEKFRMKGDEY